MASVYKRQGAKRWSISYTDENGARRVVTGLTGKVDSDRLAAELQAEADRRRRGLSDPAEERLAEQGRVPLYVLDVDGKVAGGHLADFHQALLDRGGTAKNAHMKAAQVLRILQACKAERASDLLPAPVQRALKSLHDDDGLSLRTCNHYLRSVKQFSRWLHRERRAREDSLQHLAGFNAALDRRHRRRVLS
ncbi:MAG TPA: hypothetical protein VMW52_04350, partial [Phycisphaerae bacterium]|nr:hypothetical protein [Phycisphaerae bacterium]